MGRITVEPGNLFKQALDLFDEASMEFYKIVYSGGTDEGGVRRAKALKRMGEKYSALTDYVSALEQQNQALRNQLEERIRRKL